MTSIHYNSLRSRSGHSLYKAYLSICIVFLATSPAFLLGEDNRNIGLIAFMFICPLFIRIRRLTTDHIFLFGFILSVILFPLIFHYSQTRWSTIFYSLMFCGLYVSYDSLLQLGYLNIYSFTKIIRYLIILYAVTLFIQQLCLIFGLPIFNVSNYDPSEPWKLNSLAAEPSHSARIVGIMMFSYLSCSKYIFLSRNCVAFSAKQNFVVWLCFLWSMITMVSATAVVMLVVVLISYIRKLNLRDYISAFCIAAFGILAIPADLVDRAVGVSSAVLTLDYNAVLMADHSGGMRIAPMLVLIDLVELNSIVGLFGNGVDSIGYFLSSYIWGVEDGFTGGGLLALWYEYGFITFLFFVFFTARATAAFKGPSNFLIWFLIVFLSGVNSQMVWLTLILLNSLRYYERHHFYP